MKLLKKSISVILALILLCSAVTVVSAAETGEGIKFISAENTETKLIYTDGTAEIFPGAIDPESIEPSGIAEKIKSYELLYDGESVFEVTLNDIHSTDGDALADSSVPTRNGYYAAEFELTGQNKSAYITGLTPGNISLIQRALIKSYATEELLFIEDFDFIDADKNHIKDNDLCWAGTCSNMLAYTGWGVQGGFADTDDVFDEFADDFKDDGFNIQDGLRWFFNGVTGVSRNYTTLIDLYNSGNYITKVPFENVNKVYRMDEYTDVEFISELITRLKEGCAIGLHIRWGYTTGQDTGGHAITCWGYIENNEYPEDDFRHYDSLIVSDSDDGPSFSERRMSPNKLKAIKMSAYSSEVPKYTGIIFPNYINGVMYEFVALSQYEAGKYEDNTPGAVYDRRNNVDLISEKAVASTSAANSDGCSRIPLGADAYVFASISNISETAYSGDVDVSVTVTDSKGAEVASGQWTEKPELSDYNKFVTLNSIKIEKPAAGTYTVEVTVASTGETAEAFYSNNTSVSTFEVADLGFDISESSIEAQIVSPDDPEDFTTLDYIAIPDEIIESSLGLCVYAEYNDNGVIKTDSIPPESGEALPSSYTIQKHLGNKVRFVLTAELKDIGIISICSQEYELEYDDIVLEVTKDCTKEFTPIEYMQMGFNEGEKVEFTVTNTSKNDVFTGTVKMNISGVSMTGYMQSGDVELTLGPGETSEKIVFDSWETNTAEGGTANIIVTAEGVCGDGVDVSNFVYIGRIKSAEKPKTTVNNKICTVDRYDGLTSLPEAISYCPDGGTVSFSNDVREVWGSTAALEKTELLVMDIDKDITIDGGYYCRNGNLCGVAISECSFDVKKNARLKLRGLMMLEGSSVPLNNGSAIYSRGDLRIEDCLLDSWKSNIAGGAVYIDGGTAELVNTTFFNDCALYGGAFAINNGAKVNVLNCSVLNCASRTGSVYNANGELNIFNSDLMFGNTEAVYEDNGTSLTGNTVTRVVNSVFYCSQFAAPYSEFDVSGDVELYGCAFYEIADGVFSDERCEAVSSFSEMADINDLYIFAGGCYEDDKSVHTIVNIYNDFRARGYIVSVEDGYVVYSDGENTYQTGIESVFSNDDYAVDMFGTQRDRAYGCCCDVTQIGKTIFIKKGDVNCDGTIDILDVAAVQKYSVDKLELDEEQLSLGDVNNNGVVNVLDAEKIQEYCVGKISEFVNNRG